MSTKKPTFEENLAQLEEILTNLEAGQGNLEQSLAQYQKGVKLVQTCQKQLDQARLKVTQLNEPEGESAHE